MAEREAVAGFCGMSVKPVIAKAFLHRWEEPCISGSRGSGTVFFSGCNLKCIYCQNYAISQDNFGKQVSTQQLAEIFLSLQEQGAHNINLVNPSHFILQIRQALVNSHELKIPVVYNSNAYEKKHTLKDMMGLVDVYLPDIKYHSSQVSQRYSGAEDYFKVASAAVEEMYSQVGAPVLDDEGIIKKGLIIRHLILPGQAADSIKILDWIASSLPKGVFVSIMSQYTPYYRAECHPEINRRITRREYDRVIGHTARLGLEYGYIQERASAEECYIPGFDLEGV